METGTVSTGVGSSGSQDPRGPLEVARRTLEGLIGVPATEGNRVEILRNGNQIFPAMLDAIEGATRSVDLLTFIYWSGDVGRRFAEALAAKARQGVRVRILLDAIGSRNMDDGLLDTMSSAGCDLRWFRPVRRGHLGQINRRTHRKVLICDEQLSFTGGVGIADEWQGDARDETEWRDTHIRFDGPATDGLRAAFIDNWAETGGRLYHPDVDLFPEQRQTGGTTIQVVRGAAETGWSEIATMVRVMLTLARHRVRMTTAYFNPDDVLLDVLCDTVARGVEVEILLPGPHADKRFVQVAGEATYQRLLDCGVVLWSYQPSMLHAKVLTIDGLLCTVGSANMNNRSTQYDEEVNLVLFDPAVTEELDRHFDEDIGRSVLLDAARWSKRSRLQQTRERVVTAARGLI